MGDSTRPSRPGGSMQAPALCCGGLEVTSTPAIKSKLPHLATGVGTCPALFLLEGTLFPRGIPAGIHPGVHGPGARLPPRPGGITPRLGTSPHGVRSGLPRVPERLAPLAPLLGPVP